MKFKRKIPRIFTPCTLLACGRDGGLKVSVLDSGSSGPSSSPSREHCAKFLSKTLLSHIVSLHPWVEMGTGDFNAGG